MTSGTPFDEQALAKQRDRDIVVTVLYDGLPSGGMTWQITPRVKQGQRAEPGAGSEPRAGA